MQRSDIFNEIRKIKSTLSTDQVKAGDEIMDKLGEDIVAKLIGLSVKPVDILTVDKLKKIYPNANTAFVDSINKYTSKYGIDTKERMAMFLAQVIHESGGFLKLRESLAYTAQRLVQVFPTRIKTVAIATSLVNKGQSAIGDAIYGGRFGNGTNNGDGFKYRGGGLLHLTFKDNYQNATSNLKKEGFDIDLVKNPEKIIEPDIAVLTALIFWKNNNVNIYSDKKDITGATKVVNGGTNGLDERKSLYAKAIQYL